MKPIRAVDFRPLILNGEIILKPFQKLLFRQSVEISHNSVVIDNPQMRSRESHCKEIIIFLLAGMAGIRFSLFKPYTRSGRRAVVTVGNIKMRHLGKFFCDCGGQLIIIDNPEMVAESVRSHKIIFRLPGSNLSDHTLKHLIVGESKKHRFDIGIIHLHMLHAVILLVAAGQLMLLDNSVYVILHISGNHNTILRATVHGLGIDIIVVFIILNKPPVAAERAEILHSLVIHLWVMLVSARLEIDFRLDYMIKRLRIPLGFLTGFFRI